MGKSLSRCLMSKNSPKTIDYSGSKPIPSPSGENLTASQSANFAKHSTLSNKSKHADQSLAASSFKRRDSHQPKALSAPNKCIFQHASVIDFHFKQKSKRSLLGQKKSLPSLH